MQIEKTLMEDIVFWCVCGGGSRLIVYVVNNFMPKKSVCENLPKMRSNTDNYGRKWVIISAHINVTIDFSLIKPIFLSL